MAALDVAYDEGVVALPDDLTNFPPLADRWNGVPTR